MKRSINCLLLILIGSLAAGCSQTSGLHCEGWKALRPTKGDIRVISTPFKRQVVGHNMHGASKCGWKP
jgi:hypothetical protein